MWMYVQIFVFVWLGCDVSAEVYRIFLGVREREREMLSRWVDEIFFQTYPGGDSMMC